MAAHFTGTEAVVDYPFPMLPPLAWAIAPLTMLPLAAAYAAWTAIGLASLVIAWWFAAPYRGIARIALLLAAVAIWPVHYSLIFGQSTAEIMALVALAWWFLQRDQAAGAGIALALATGLKPQDLFLVPIALLIARRVRIFMWWAGACAALGLVIVAALGVQGVVDFWQAIGEGERFPGHKILTLASLFGPGLPAYLLQAGSVVVALVGAWRHRMRIEIVLALGLSGSVTASVHAHESDFSMFVLAAWFVLAAHSSAATRLWLLPGILAAQAMAIGLALPILLWEVVWLLLLVFDAAGSGRLEPYSADSSGANAVSDPGRGAEPGKRWTHRRADRFASPGRTPYERPPQAHDSSAPAPEG
jgi:hypothetical protein